ncbi:MAG TPA: hypothetical protein VFF83_09735 [Clostridia bacterium]|nr:hypothetical protein [Clostridia bacterium]
MRRKLMLFSFFLCFVLLLTACGGSSAPEPAGGESAAEEAEVSGGEAPEAEPTKEKPSGVPGPKSGFEKINDIADAWNALYSQNEKAINDYEGMPILELVSPGRAFVTGVQYDLLNMDDKDGRFEGKLMFAGFDGFVEKAGSKFTFGHDYVLEKDGLGPFANAGDRKVENGIFDTDKEFYQAESYTERGGTKILRQYHEFKRLGDGSMICFDFSGNAIDAKGDEKTFNIFTFIRSGKDRYDFVIAKAEIGPEFNIVSLANEGDMTKERAIEIFTAEGYSIDKTGGIKDGKLFVD